MVSHVSRLYNMGGNAYIIQGNFNWAIGLSAAMGITAAIIFLIGRKKAFWCAKLSRDKCASERHFTGKYVFGSAAFIDVKVNIKSIWSLEWWACWFIVFFSQRDKRSDWTSKNLPLVCFRQYVFECQNDPMSLVPGIRLMAFFEVFMKAVGFILTNVFWPFVCPHLSGCNWVW